jgi:hypothetical protein
VRQRTLDPNGRAPVAGRRHSTPYFLFICLQRSDKIPGMTIREYIRRRFRALVLIFAVPYAALQVDRFAMLRWPTVITPKPWVFALTGLPAFWVFLAWFAIRVVTMPCPRCKRLLGGALATIWGGGKVNRCPHCRVGLDEPAVIPRIVGN